MSDALSTALTRGNVLGAIANPVVANPLAAYAGAVNTADTLMRLRQLQAQQVAGQAYQGAIDENGAFSPERFRQNLAAAGPGAAMAAGPALANVQNIASNQLAMAQNKSAELNSTLGALLSKPSITPQDINDAGTDLMRRGIYTPAEVQAAIGGMPSDPSQLRDWVYQHQVRNLAMGDQINRQQTMGMPPAQYYQPTDIQLGNGQVIQVPYGLAGQILSANPELRRLNPNLSGGGPVTNQSFGPNQGRYLAPAPSAPSGPLWKQPPPAPVVGGTAGGVGVTAAPGYVEAQKATAGNSVAAANTLQTQVSASRDIEPILSDMDAQLDTPGFTPGLGSTSMSSVRQLMQRFGLVAEEPRSGTDLASPQAAQELFAKNAARLQAAQMGALGNPTDARQELAEVTNPGLFLSKYGNRGIIHMLQGNQQAIRAMGDSWAQAQAQGWTPDRFNEWMNQRFLATDRATGGRFDPRVFWFANEGSLDAQRTYAAKIPEGPARRQFLANLQYAKNMGWISQAKDGTTQIAMGPAQ